MSKVDTSYQQREINTDLRNVPGDYGLPFFGDIFDLVRSPTELMRRKDAKYGPVSKIRLTGQPSVLCSSPSVFRQICLDPDKAFSPMKGYEPIMGQFYTGGLLLRDYDEHRIHRRIFQTAFKNNAMRRYTDVMNDVIHKHTVSWAGVHNFHFFPAIKAMLLDMAGEIFLGVEGDEAQQFASAFTDIGKGMLSFSRVDSKYLPLTTWRQGHEAKRFMCDYFISHIEERRNSDKHDIFTLVCKEKDENGNYFSDEDIAGHINFLLFAAHDTTTSNLCYMMQHMAQNPEVKAKALAESNNFGRRFLDYDDIQDVPYMDKIRGEALRMNPPVQLINRRTTKDVQMEKVIVPADTILTIVTEYTHMDPRHWEKPEIFNPERFDPKIAEHKQGDPWKYIPFGGGAHKCIGMHFSIMGSKLFMHQMLQLCDWTVPRGYNPKQSYFPLPKQSDGLPLKIHLD